MSAVADVGRLVAARGAGVESLGVSVASTVVRFGRPVRPYTASTRTRTGSVRELRGQAQAWNRARTRVLKHLRVDAKKRGAPLVVDVSLRRIERAWGTHVVEVVAAGTAVSASGLVPPRRPEDVLLATIGADETMRLLDAGWRPVGVAGGSTVVYVVAGGATRIGTFRSREVPEYTRGIAKARASVVASLTHEAAAAGATGVVAFELDHHVHEHREEGTRRDLVVTMHALATAIAPQRAGRPRAPALAVELR